MKTTLEFSNVLGLILFYVSERQVISVLTVQLSSKSRIQQLNQLMINDLLTVNFHSNSKLRLFNLETFIDGRLNPKFMAPNSSTVAPPFENKEHRIKISKLVVPPSECKRKFRRLVLHQMEICYFISGFIWQKLSDIRQISFVQYRF